MNADSAAACCNQRVGGEDPVSKKAETAVVVHTSHVIIGGPTTLFCCSLRRFFPFVSGSKERLAAVDNIWLWRADHDSAGPVRDGKHPSKHGLIVRGDNGEPNAFLRPTMAVEAIQNSALERSHLLRSRGGTRKIVILSRFVLLSGTSR